MNSSFFRDCMPYWVESQDNYLVLYNHDGHVIFKGEKPRRLNINELFNEIGAYRIGETICYMYVDNPAGNQSGYVAQRMNDYLNRLKILFKALGNTEAKVKEPYEVKDLKLKDAWEIISTMSKSIAVEDRIIADLMSIVGDKKVGRKEESSTFTDVEP